MTFTLTVPSTYGFVVLTGGVGPFVTNLVLSGAVMAARSKYKVFYPNLYAVPGVHEKADEFNRVQRSHQNMMELNDSIIVMTLLGGLKHPIACSIGSVLYCIGLVLYQRGYVDNSLDVKTARYQKGGILKWVGVGTVVVSTCSLAFSMLSAQGNPLWPSLFQTTAFSPTDTRPQRLMAKGGHLQFLGGTQGGFTTGKP